MKRDRGLEGGTIDPALHPRDLLEAGDLEALALFEHGDELRGVEQAVGGAGIQPGGASPEGDDPQATLCEVEALEVGDLQLAARGGAQAAGQRGRVRREKIQSGNRVVGFRIRGLLLDGEHIALGADLDHAVGPGVGHAGGEDRGLLRARVGRTELLGEVLPVEEVVPKGEGEGFGAFEKAAIRGDRQRLGHTVGGRLDGVAESGAEAGSIAEQALEEGAIRGGRDEEDVAQARQQEHGKRVVDHRFVVNGQQLFARSEGHRIEPGAGSAGEEDAAPAGGRSVDGA